jgi:hypothetical protein
MWRWLGDDPASPQAFGNPATATSYTLCIYDAAAGMVQRAAQFALPPGSNWSARGNGFAYRDRAGSSDGVTSARLSVGGTGRVRLVVRGNGALSLPPPVPAGGMFAKDPAVTAQLVSDSGACWEAIYSEARINDADIFAAR